MRRAIVASAFGAACLVLQVVSPTHASVVERDMSQLDFVEDTPPTFENGSVDPNKTADPPAVAAAQKALAEFFDHTNRNYSAAGFANPREMREHFGNRQSNWLDKTMPLACGRLVAGYKGRNWIPGKGWAHEAPPRASESASVPCTYRAPAPGEGGPHPDETLDPPAVEAAQKALASFYRFTNDNYSARGYSNAQLMREELGNASGRWLDQALALARGEFECGFRCMNWIPNKGWAHEALPTPSPRTGQRTPDAPALSVATWSIDVRAMAGDTAAILAPQPTLPSRASVAFDPVVERIIESFRLPLESLP